MDYRGVNIRVLPADALSYRSDLLVLKYAQASYGVDRQAIHIAGIDEAALPRIDSSLLISRPRGMQARDLLLLGVESIGDFGYQSIRNFSYRALAEAAGLTRPVREISMTLHGVGFGLDELEAFESEIAGIVAALRMGRCPADLVSVTIVERDPGRATRMQQALADLLDYEHADKFDAGGRRTPSRRIDSVGYDSAKRAHAFVAMPFAESFGDIFYYGIAPPVRAAGLLCERIDQIAFTGDIIDRMKERISSSAVIIADLSDANPNVYLEVGYAWGVEVPCILLCNRRTDLKFDIQGHRCLFYESIMGLEKILSAELRGLSLPAQAATPGSASR